MSNLLSDSWKDYVGEQITVRQSNLGALEKTSEQILWENAKTSYIALASSVDVRNTPIFKTVVSANFSSPTPPPQLTTTSTTEDTSAATDNLPTAPPEDEVDDRFRYKIIIPDWQAFEFAQRLYFASYTNDYYGTSTEFDEDVNIDIENKFLTATTSQTIETARVFARPNFRILSIQKDSRGKNVLGMNITNSFYSVGGTDEAEINFIYDKIRTQSNLDKVSAQFAKLFPEEVKANGPLESLIFKELQNFEVSVAVNKNTGGSRLNASGDTVALPQIYPDVIVNVGSEPLKLRYTYSNGFQKEFPTPSGQLNTPLSVYVERPNQDTPLSVAEGRIAKALEDSEELKKLTAAGDPIADTIQKYNNKRKSEQLFLKKQIDITTEQEKVGEDTKGTRRIQEMSLPGEPSTYFGSKIARNLVLTNSDRFGVLGSQQGVEPHSYAKTDIFEGNYNYGFGDDSDWGLVAMPGLNGMDIKSKNMGSLREVTISIRANSEAQFALIDAMYCRIGYTMFLEWGHSVYFDSNNTYVSNPMESQVNSLIPNFLKGPESEENSDNDTLYLKSQIEKNREISGGNYDAFFGRVANFSWDFNPGGYYTINLKLVSVGDIIESLQIDQPLADNKTLGTLPQEGVQENLTSALSTFLTVASTPNGSTLYDRNLFTDDSLEKTLSISKTTLVASSTFNQQGIGTDAQVKTATTSSDFSPDITYERAKNSKGKIISARAAFGNDIYYYVRFGDILDFIKTKLLIYNPEISKTPIVTIDTDPDTNYCYYSGVNLSADPSKVMVKVPLPTTLPKLRGWGNQQLITSATDVKKYWPYNEGLNQDYIFNQPDKGVDLENFVTTTSGNIEAGNIMNIYFEYEYLLGVISSNRDEKTKSLNLLDFINDLCDTASSCLGGVNKLTSRILDDRIIQIYDQISPYGSQKKSSSVINLFGVKPSKSKVNTSKTGEETLTTVPGVGSFVRNFDLKTELTSEFASQVTIGAQAQGSKNTTDATALSNWNYGLIDRWIPKKSGYDELQNQTKEPTNYESLIRLREKLMYLYCAYAEGKVSSLYRSTLTDEQTKQLQTQSDNAKSANSNEVDSDDTYLDESNVYNFKNFPVKRYSSFVKLQQDFLALLHINSNYNSNQMGMLPIKMSVDLEGLSGIRIFDNMPVDVRFIPNYYNQTLNWIISGVSHKITNNEWTTTLETIAVPKLPELKGGEFPTTSEFGDNSYFKIPEADIATSDENPQSDATSVGTTNEPNAWSQYISRSDVPWSAAFISYTVRKAEGTSPSFPGRASHAVYAEYIRAGKASGWTARNPSTTQLRAGDIVVKNRSNNTLTFSSKKWQGKTHGDIVTQLSTTKASIVGGNVNNAVRAKTINLTNKVITPGQGYYVVLRPPTSSSIAAKIVQGVRAQLKLWQNPNRIESDPAIASLLYDYYRAGNMPAPKPPKYVA